MIQITSDPAIGSGSVTSTTTDRAKKDKAGPDWLYSFAGIAFWREGWRHKYYEATSDLLDMMLARVGQGPEADPGLLGPLNILLQARSLTGSNTMESQRTRTIKGLQGSYYHFSMAGARAIPLSWSLSSDAGEELESLLRNEHNAAEMNRLVEELNRP